MCLGALPSRPWNVASPDILRLRSSVCAALWAPLSSLWSSAWRFTGAPSIRILPHMSVKHDCALATSLMYIGPTSHSMTASPSRSVSRDFSSVVFERTVETVYNPLGICAVSSHGGEHSSVACPGPREGSIRVLISHGESAKRVAPGRAGRGEVFSLQPTLPALTPSNERP